MAELVAPLGGGAGVADEEFDNQPSDADTPAHQSAYPTAVMPPTSAVGGQEPDGRRHRPSAVHFSTREKEVRILTRLPTW